MSAPERIWVNLDSNEDGCCPVEDDLSDTGKFFDRNSSVEYTRTDAIPNAAYVAGLEAAMERIMDRHIPDQPAAYGGDELAWVTRQHTELRHIAITALASRPASPDVRVVALTDAIGKLGLRKLVAGWNGEHLEKQYAPHPPQLGVALKTTAGVIYEIDAALRAIIAGQP